VASSNVLIPREATILATTKASRQPAGRHRSPAYPIIPLNEAIEKVEIIYKHDKRAFTSHDALFSILEYKKGGFAGRVISALQQFGLLERHEGKYRVSEAGFQIINLPKEDLKRIALIRNAALMPPLFTKLVELYEGELPSDATLKSHLILSEGFNPDSVGKFIRALRGTLDFAKIPSVGYVPLSETEGTLVAQTYKPEPDAARRKEIIGRSLNATLGAQLQTLGVPVHPGQKPFPFYLSKEQQATLYVPESMTEKEFALLKKQIENSLAVMEATIIADDKATEE